MGCSSSSPSGVASDPVIPSTVSVSVSTPPFDQKAIHSAVRWNKPLTEVKALITSKFAADCVDPSNGNCPIHIAAQNGHLDLVKLLVELKANLDAKNLKGNTAMHMAIAYDYYYCAKCLQDAGADPTILNDLGFQACRGLEGDKTFAIAALISSSNIDQVEAALKLCETDTENVDRASFVQAGLKAKKNMGSNWTSNHQTQFKAILDKLK